MLNWKYVTEWGRTMDQQEQWKLNLEELLKQLKRSPLDYQMIEVVLKGGLNSNNFSLGEFNQQFNNYFHSNPALFQEYMEVPQIFSIADLSLDSPTYKKALDFINNIKLTYGSRIRKFIIASRDPFIISSVETNIAHNETSHTIKFERGDGEALNGTFKPASLMAILASLTGALRFSLERGIFNIDQNVLDLYLSESAELKKSLEELMESSDVKTNE